MAEVWCTRARTCGGRGGERGGGCQRGLLEAGVVAGGGGSWSGGTDDALCSRCAAQRCGGWETSCNGYLMQ